MQLFYPLELPSENIGIHGFHDTTKNQSQSYIPITGCVLSHILSCSRLSSLEKMYYILADSLSCINSSKGRNRSVSLPAKSWSERLACSKSEVFVLQKSLEDKGYFIIYRDKNDKGQNNRNTITTTIPDHVFNDLKYESNRFNLNSDGEIEYKTIGNSQSYNLDSIDKTFIPTLEGKRQHLEKTKMFIRVPYQFLKELNSNCNISATSKILLLYLFMKIYKSSASKYDYGCSGSRHDYDNAVDYLTHNSNSIVTSYQELQVELKLHRNSLTKALKTLEEANLINRDQMIIKSDDDYNSRADKSLWKISLLKICVGGDNKCKKQQSIDNDITLKSFKDKGCTKYNPPCTDSGQLYNKDFILKSSIIKNVDYIDEKREEEFFEDKQSLSSSKSYNNSSFLNDSCKKTLLRQKVNQKADIAKSTHRDVLEQVVQKKEQLRVLNNKQNTKRKELAKPNLTHDQEQRLELRHFYPLSGKDISMLNSKADREFSNNFVNQLLLKLYIKYPEKRFKNRFTFLSYMERILANLKVAFTTFFCSFLIY